MGLAMPSSIAAAGGFERPQEHLGKVDIGIAVLSEHQQIPADRQKFFVVAGEVERENCHEHKDNGHTGQAQCDGISCKENDKEGTQVGMRRELIVYRSIRSNRDIGTDRQVKNIPN